ncbi:hypothetical protein CB0940_05449 [Cercospora beticola]|uniref:Aminoglycoside phosphotransferase domain-containing protein n=1 Tax=Cercospora beticola TaxID=122368 RepID=A0A2G5I0I3_CERBT|nr:hypothetical protein CB0940_05449 [Cercospora beticola]PIA98280.1 hypothetical protein CB0940_05449 [Cercospora beticola]WPA97996.1 hypothetical protein RHO25_002607 [Cercospora beticola]CAK1359201.1 unnamed protein product [Cercospora beticola]
MTTDNGTPWTPVSLPYFANSGPVDKLPSAEDIRGCTDVLHERFRAKIVAVSQQIVAKFGGDVLEREGQALIYLERHVPKVPAPRLYAMYYHEKELFLVMQRAPGVQLEKLWPSLTSSEKQFIVAELHNVFHQLRETVCPAPAYFGGLAGEGVNHHLFFNQKDDDQDLLGPFHGEAAFLEGLTSNFRASRERNGHPVFKVQFYEDHLSNALRGLSPVLTHGDVQRRNIMVAERKRSTPEESERRFDVFLVDWEMAAWLPEFWEYYSASKEFNLTGIHDDWCWYVGKFLDVRLAEAAALTMFEKDYS